MSKKRLAVFDFDHTIINDNSDVAVINLIDRSNIPEEVQVLHKDDGWTAFMQGIFDLLHEKGASLLSIKTLVENLPPVDGVIELIKVLEKNNFDIIIISDCNSYFIDIWLEKNGLQNVIFKVFTNPAYINDDGKLNISMFHVQNSCKLSSKNLCKGQILEDFIEERAKNGVKYSQVIYCGDGVNDFCPILRLNENDLACVRNNYKCLDLVTKAKEGQSFEKSGQPHIVKAEVLVWESGLDILNKLFA